MKRITLLFVAVICCVAMFAKNLRTLVVSTNPQMHCESCENKIKNNVRLVKGIKSIKTDVPHQRITIVYDADKTDSKTIVAAFGKIKYQATVISDTPVAADAKSKSKVDAQSGASVQR